MRQIINPVTAFSVIQDHLPTFASTIQQGFDDWVLKEKLSAEAGIPTGSLTRTKATVIHNCIINRVAEVYNGSDNPLARHYNKIFGIPFDEGLFLRFKKFKNDLSVANHSSGQNSAYTHQRPIFGIPATQYLYAGYTVDSAFTDISGIYIVCRYGAQVLWYTDLTTMNTVAQRDLFDEEYSDFEQIRALPAARRVTPKPGVGRAGGASISSAA
jgi:hypothetical protein